jgi:hypothetical protein
MFFAQVQGFNPEIASKMFLANMYGSLQSKCGFSGASRQQEVIPGRIISASHWHVWSVLQSLDSG